MPRKTSHHQQNDSSMNFKKKLSQNAKQHFHSQKKKLEIQEV
jgi:hypothetical protein